MSSSATVSGKVTYKGAPLKGGYVTLVTATGISRPGGISEDGSYTIDNVPTGPVKIAVDTESIKPRSSAGKGGMAPPKKYGPPPGAEQPSAPAYKPPDPTAGADRYVAIPQKYADPEKSGLTYTVKSGSQTHDIPLD
jgi:hypothetical protein